MLKCYAEGEAKAVWWRWKAWWWEISESAFRNAVAVYVYAIIAINAGSR
jgi:hypothetical protein